jgi:hypothetical protein
MRQFNAGNQWLKGRRKTALFGSSRTNPGRFRLRKPEQRAAGEPTRNGVSPVPQRSGLLHVQPAHKVPLAQGNAVGAQDVVGGGGVEIEIGQRE